MVTLGHRGDISYVFFCLSADPLPVKLPTGMNIPIGTELYVTDLYQHMVWTGSAWDALVEDVVEDPVYNPLLMAMQASFDNMTSILGQVLAQLQLMNIGMGQDPTSATVDLNASSSTLFQ